MEAFPRHSVVDTVFKRTQNTLTFYAFPLLTKHRKRKMRSLARGSTIYETFSPFNAVLCFCGFWYSCNNAKSKCAILESIKILLSVLYSLLFCALFITNVMWGIQVTDSVDSVILKIGWHQMTLIQLLFLSIFIWSNYSNRRKINECLQLVDQYDVMCQVSMSVALDGKSLYNIFCS